MNGRDFSLLAKYDEFCRGFRGCMSAPYYEFEDFARVQEDNRKKWMSIQEKCSTVLKDLKEAQSHKEKLELQIQHVTELLKNEVHIRQRVEREEKDLEKKLGFVKHIVTADRNLTGETRERILSMSSIDLSHRHDFESTRNNLVDTMSEDIECSTRSILSSLDITSDKTDEDLELSTLRSIRDVKGRRSTELLDAMHPKGILKGINADGNAPRLSLANDPIAIRNLTLGIGREGDHHETPDLLKVPVIEVSSSQNIEEIELDSTTIGSPTDVETSSESTPIKEPIRPHNFVSKVILKQELCVPCNARIRFGKSAMKCTECFAICHVDCKDKMPTPCSPAHKTPTQAKVTLADYAPRNSPLVPAIITNCVNEIETRGIGYSALYRTDAHEKEISCVKEQILQAKLHTDQLRSTNINVLAGVMRSFLQSLNEPLITCAARESFCKICYVNRIAEVQDTVCSLLREFPEENRETLSFLILHFQRVTNGTVCSTPVPSVAKYFASALFGCPLSPITDGLKKLQDLKEQQLATEKLISLPAEFWVKVASASNDIKSPVYRAKRNLKKGFFTSPHF